MSGEARDERGETNRDRVRRLLFGPLGFRSKRGVSPEDERGALSAIADELAYLRNDELEILARMMRVHGEGTARNFWPDRASFIGFAHLVRPLPLDADPKLRRWFASVEGPRALADGSLVETWAYFEKRRVPPATPQARALVSEKAAGNRHRLLIVREKQARGVDPGREECVWADGYEAQRDRLAALVRELRAEKGVSDAA